MHESGHALHWSSMTPEEYADLKGPEKEQYVYNWLRSTPGVWDSLAPEEQEHAMGYIGDKQGKAFGFLNQKPGNGL
jgi:hypothetical protein